jgi:hypothetical protein
MLTKKNQFIAATLLGFVLTTASTCRNDTRPPDPEPTEKNLKLTFFPRYKNNVWVANKVYPLNDTARVRFTKFSFFITDVIAAGATMPQILESANVDFSTMTDSAQAAKGWSIGASVPSGTTFQQLQMTIGVADALNAKRPGQYPLSSPLSDTDQYWATWNSFIFSKLEGVIDRDNDGRFESAFTLHTGGAEVAKTIAVAKTILGGQTTEVQFNVSLDEVLKNITLLTAGSTHNPSDLPFMKVLLANHVTAISLK